MSYSGSDFVDSIAGIVSVSDDAVERWANSEGYDNPLSDDARFAAWAAVVCNRIEALTKAAAELASMRQPSVADILRRRGFKYEGGKVAELVRAAEELTQGEERTS